MVNFLILLILHFVGDFYLQTTKLANCKNANVGENCNNCSNCKKKAFFNNKYLIFHTFLYVVPFLLLFCMTKWTTMLIIMAILLVSHYVADIFSCYLNKKLKHVLVFVLDQTLHIAIIIVTYKLFDLNSVFLQYEIAIKIVFSILLLMVPVSVFINKLFQDLFPNTEQGKIFDVGSVIGILERILVMIFACFNNFATIAIIITIKTWARTSDIKKEDDFRNKYLLGTLASLVWALVAFLIYKL